MPFKPRNFCFGGEGDAQLFLAGPDADAVVIVYPYQNEVAEPRLAGRTPDAMASIDRCLLVAKPETNGITVLSMEDYQRVAQVAVGQEPRHILVTPDRQYALVLNQTSGDVAVIRIAVFSESRDKSR